MAQEEPSFWEKARHAREKLVDQFLNHPNVSLIDIGYDLDPRGGETAKRIVLRVHMRRSLTREEIGLPDQIDDIPVRVIVADYRLE